VYRQSGLQEVEEVEEVEAGEGGYPETEVEAHVWFVLKEGGWWYMHMAKVRVD